MHFSKSLNFFVLLCLNSCDSVLGDFTDAAVPVWLLYVFFFRLLFEIDSLDRSKPRASSSKSYNVTDHEKGIIEELRSWASQKEYLNKKFAITNLKDLSVSQTFINLLCQVVSKCYTMSGNGVVLTLWDGSFPACRSIQVEPISEQGPLTSDELVKKSANRCVEVFLYDDHMEGDVKNVCPGDFVCIRNVHLKEEKNNSSLTTDDSKVTFMFYFNSTNIFFTCFVLFFIHISDRWTPKVFSVLCGVLPRIQYPFSFHFDHSIKCRL